MNSRKMAALAAVVGLTGCYKISYTTNNPIGSGEPDEQVWQHRFINGIVETGPVKADGICPNGIAKVETQVSFVNGLANYGVGMLISPLVYNPGTVKVWCSSGGAYNIEIDEDGAVASLVEVDAE